MRYVFIALFCLVATSILQAQDGTITAVARTQDGAYRVTFSAGPESSVPPAPGNRLYERVIRWIADGNTVTQDVQPVAERKSDAMDRMLRLHTRILALEREKTQNPAQAVRLQAMIDQAQAQIDAIRPSS